MFKKLFARGEEGSKSIFLAGWEVTLNGDQECENFIATQITNAKTVESIYCGLELVFENNRLVRAFEYEEGSKREKILEPEELGLMLPKLEPNKILALVENPSGPHQLGGEIPSGFKMPENNCIVPFQYLGYIDNKDPYFQWLPFKLHLTCPIYLNIENVFLDYSDHLNPSIINKEEVENADTSYEDELNQESEIVFEEMKFKFVEDLEFPLMGHAGIPRWTQAPAIPICPRSGKRMRFLCQLNRGVKTKRSNVHPENEWYAQYFEKLNFWGDGDLYVFFEPDSKIACYFIQNT